MTLLDQFLREIGDNSLGSAIEFRRHAFDERRDLSNLHDD
jgi:hypothetical protein